MEFGVLTPSYSPYSMSLILKSARLAEDLDFKYFLVNDHFLTPFTDETFDAWTLLAFIAGMSKRIQIGTCVTPIPLRPPAIFAKTISTLDVLSNGRVVVGIGAGDYQKDFEIYSIWDEANIRIKKMIEGIKIMKGLWTKDRFTFKGKFYSVVDGVLSPKPVQKPHPPLWFGSIKHKDYMLKLTAKYGDGWIPVWDTPPSEFAKGVKRIEEFARSFNRKNKITYAFNAGPIVPDELDSMRVNLWIEWPGIGISKSVENIEKYKAVGCSCYIPWFHPPEKQIGLMEKFAKDIMACF
ncbi:MAG: LLM class flavin-dependent oxidoreductase [Candidatus Bathyarchaeia archaeon]